MHRRRFLTASLAFLLWPLAARGRPQPKGGAELPASLLESLESSPFVYVSPLRADGSESTCHGEVWYAWLDGAVVLNTAATTWKSQALARGLDRARLWVGDHGRWKRPLGGRNEAFRGGPSFEARAERSRDAELLDRMLARFEEKYPEEIGSWRHKMRQGFLDGTRLLIRYQPEVPRT